MMTLILSAQSSSNYAHSDLLRHEFDQQGGTIGRSRNNTWMLPDDHKHLSGQHAKIEFIDEQYFITDISTNGIFINGDEKPLGPNNRMPLQNGDILRMGWYDVTVTLPTATVASAHIDEPSNAHPLADVPTCIVGASDALIPPPSPTSSTNQATWDDEPTPIPQKSSSYASNNDPSNAINDDLDWDDEWWQTDKVATPSPTPVPSPTPSSNPIPSPVDTPSTTPVPAPATAIRNNNPEADHIDPDKLFDDDEWWKSDKDNPTSANSNNPNDTLTDTLSNELDDDAFVPQANSPQAPLQQTQHQAQHNEANKIIGNPHHNSINNPINEADINQPSIASIDPSFENDLNTDLNFDDATQIHQGGNNVEHLAAAPATTPEIKPATPIPQQVAQQNIPNIEAQPQPIEQAQTGSKITPEQLAETPLPSSTLTPPSTSTTAEPLSQKTEPNSSSTTTETSNTAEQQINAAALQAFIKGLGINDADVEKRISRDLDFEKVGHLFRHSVQGILDLLYSRADIKNEMRMDMTTIQPIENNPLKFAIHVDDALHDLLCKQNKNYLPPEQALNEAYDDIRAHQIAVISGIQASIHELLARFEPEKLSERLQKRSTIAANIPGLRKAKLWALFEELHETIQQEAHNDFSRLFGAAFADAYDQQVRVLRQNAKNKTSA